MDTKIRLLEIQEDDKSSRFSKSHDPEAKHRVSCRLKHVRLGTISELGSFEALSYVGGEPKFTHYLYTDSTSSHVKVTEGLHNVVLGLPRA